MHIGKIYPIELNETTAYLAGAIIGDGYIAGSNHKIHIILTDFDYISTIALLTKEIVATSAKIGQLKVPEGRKPTWSFSVKNKSWWYFFTTTLGVPCGAKSRLVAVPEKISSGNTDLKKAFLAGLFDTDGGLKGNRIGFTSASKSMCDQLPLLLNELGFQCSVSSWVIKKYNWRYFGLRLFKRDIGRFLKEIPLRNEGKKAAIFERFIRGRTEVV